MADHPYSLKFTRMLATKMAALHDLAHGRVQKCCILDLDHTLWGGRHRRMTAWMASKLGEMGSERLTVRFSSGREN